MKYKEFFFQLVLFGSCLSLTGCPKDFYVSQNPQMGRFVGQSSDQIYQHAKAALKGRQYNHAISTLRAFIALYPEDPKIELVYRELIECYAARGQFTQAIQVIDKFLTRYPDSKYSDTLKNRKETITNKQNMDALYHRTWLQILKDKHKQPYSAFLKRMQTVGDTKSSG